MFLFFITIHNNDKADKTSIPTVNNGTLTIQRNGTTVKTFTANASSNVTANISVPTALSGLTQSSSYRTVSDTEKSKWNSKIGYSEASNYYAYVENLYIAENDNNGNGTEITSCRGGFFVVGAYSNKSSDLVAYAVYYDQTTNYLNYSELTKGSQPLYFSKGDFNDIIMHSMDSREFYCTVFRFFDE